ncbi:MAG TPA: hypothetical protein VG125_32805 [Pirellulales bacterium]|jgi:hypothetical protein|nr:hypothetical protein [Pirellulales bacterium]
MSRWFQFSLAGILILAASITYFTMSREKWPFDDPPNVATISVRQIIDDGAPVLFVSHDVDDGAWQFLTGGEVSTADAMVISLEEMLERDPTLAELADLKCGWKAMRERVGAPWHRSKN